MTFGATADAFIFVVDNADADVDVDAQNVKLMAVYRSGNMVTMKIAKKTHLGFTISVTAVTA